MRVLVDQLRALYDVRLLFCQKHSDSLIEVFESALLLSMSNGSVDHLRGDGSVRVSTILASLILIKIQRYNPLLLLFSCL